jgi:hypothetical protein
MDIVLELAETEALRQLKARYFYFLDTKEWDSWLALFTPDATLKWDLEVATRGREGRTVGFSGVEAIAEHVVRGILAEATTVHHGYTPLLEMLSETEARGIWAMDDLVASPERLVHGYGHYHETYRKVDGSWKIASSHLRRIRVTATHL